MINPKKEIQVLYNTLNQTQENGDIGTISIRRGSYFNFFKNPFINHTRSEIYNSVINYINQNKPSNILDLSLQDLDIQNGGKYESKYLNEIKLAINQNNSTPLGDDYQNSVLMTNIINRLNSKIEDNKQNSKYEKNNNKNEFDNNFKNSNHVENEKHIIHTTESLVVNNEINSREDIINLFNMIKDNGVKYSNYIGVSNNNPDIIWLDFKGGSSDTLAVNCAKQTIFYKDIPLKEEHLESVLKKCNNFPYISQIQQNSIKNKDFLGSNKINSDYKTNYTQGIKLVDLKKEKIFEEICNDLIKIGEKAYDILQHTSRSADAYSRYFKETGKLMSNLKFSELRNDSSIQELANKLYSTGHDNSHLAKNLLANSDTLYGLIMNLTDLDSVMEDVFYDHMQDEKSAFKKKCGQLLENLRIKANKLKYDLGLVIFPQPGDVNVKTIKIPKNRDLASILQFSCELDINSKVGATLLNKIYKMLALQFHPDKNHGYEQAAANIWNKYLYDMSTSNLQQRKQQLSNILNNFNDFQKLFAELNKPEINFDNLQVPVIPLNLKEV